jgi:hypothetical protein
VLAQGSAFFKDGHVWFILSDPTANNRSVLCVNITTLDDDCPDDECILDHTDYEWIERGHKSAIAFSRARTWRLVMIETALARGILTTPFHRILPQATITKVLRAAKNSRELSQDKKSLL